MLQATLTIILGICSTAYCWHNKARLPFECQDIGHTVLSKDSRFFGSNTSDASLNDSTIQTGWYRFSGDVSKQMYSSLPDFKSTMLPKDTFRPCGAKLESDRTSSLYAMLQSHPKQSDGLVRNNLQACHYQAKDCQTDGAGQTSCHWELLCQAELEKEIYVRNCGEFFVYYIRAIESGSIYCTDNKMTKTEVTPRLECQHYKNVTDSSRLWNASEQFVNDPRNRCPQDELFTNQWTRFLKKRVMDNVIEEMSVAEVCPSIVNSTEFNNRAPCGALYRGWIDGYNPEEKYELVKRKLCFSNPTTCDCQASTEISIIQCNGFFVYKRNSLFPLCNSRACTVTGAPAPFNEEEQENKKKLRSKRRSKKSNDICRRAATIKDDTRYWTSINPSAQKCDVDFVKAVRFMSKDKRPLKLKEGCTSNAPTFPIGKCESRGAMWLDGVHPNVEMGVVPRHVCVQRISPIGYLIPGKYDACQCTLRRTILVQNCGDFFAYQLDPIEDCIGRYCLEGSGFEHHILPDQGKLNQDKVSCKNETMDMTPFECRVENYKTLSQSFRLFNSSLTSLSDDKFLTEGWYRVAGQAGQQLKEGNLSPFHGKLQDVIARCGADLDRSSFGIIKTNSLHLLKQSHPKVADGLVKRDIEVCSYELDQSLLQSPSVCFSNDCKWNVVCEREETTFVRNCGEFYVYYLRPTFNPSLSPFLKQGTYCTENSKTDPEVNPSLECQNYVNLTDTSRLWDADETPGFLIPPRPGPTTTFPPVCNDVKFTKTWTRLLASHSTEMFDTIIPNNCPSILKNGTNFMDRSPCGALYRGWLNGNYPEMSDGIVQRKLCFSDPHSCQCKATSDISVMNCGKFYIYKRNDFPLCKARACTVPQQKDVLLPKPISASHNKKDDFCKTFKTVVDDTRFWDNTDVSGRFCDVGFTSAVRFMSSEGEHLKLKEGCSNSGPAFPVGKCQSSQVTWLDGAHPVNEGETVVRSVCIHNPIYRLPIPYNPCQCDRRQLVKIRKCSNFYVYQLDGFAEDQNGCLSRYCLQRSGVFSPPTPPERYRDTCDLRYCRPQRSCIGTFQNGQSLVGGCAIPDLPATLGLLISKTFTKGASKQMFCFEYNKESKYGSLVRLSVHEHHLASLCNVTKLDVTLLTAVTERKCFMISDSLLPGDSFQIIFEATMANTSVNHDKVTIKRFSIENRDDHPIAMGTSFEDATSFCSKSSEKTRYCFLQQVDEPSVSWAWSKGFIKLSSTRSRFRSNLLTAVPFFSMQRRPHCLQIALKAVHRYASMWLRVFVVFSDGRGFFMGQRRITNINGDMTYYNFNVRSYRGRSFQIKISVLGYGWNQNTSMEMHDVTVSNRVCPRTFG